MKHLTAWTNWKILEANENTADAESILLKKSNSVFCSWILEKLKPNIKVKVKDFEIPFESYGSTKALSEKGEYNVRVITATYKAKRFFVSLHAPGNHRWGMDFSYRVENFAGDGGRWGRVYTLSEIGKEYFMIPYFYFGKKMKVEEPYKWYPTTSLKKIKVAFSKKVPARDTIELISLSDIVNTMLGLEIILPFKKDFYSYRLGTLIQDLIDEVQDWIAELSNEPLLGQIPEKCIESHEYFVYPYCSTREESKKK